MATKAKLYISSTIAAGLVLLAGCLLLKWEFPDLSRYFGYLMLACLASTLKIKLPKIHGTMSINFLFILIGVAQLTIAETLALGCIASLVQCLWRPRKRPTVAQLLFNMSTLVTSIVISYSVSHALVERDNLLVLLAVAVCAYFVANTGMISLVLSLTEDQPFTKVWRQCYLWSFPYYLIGAAIASAITFSSRTVGWKTSLLMLPLMYMVYAYYRVYLSNRTEQEYRTV
jgi:hypothetical protein